MANGSQQDRYEECRRRLFTAVQMAASSFELWYAYESKDGKERYGSAFSSYPFFFETLRGASFCSVFISLGRFFDKGSRSAGISQLLELAENLKLVPEQIINDIKKKLREERQVQTGVIKIRNKCIAHSDLYRDWKTVFGEAGVTPNAIKRLLTTCKEVIEYFFPRDHTGGRRVFNSPNEDIHKVFSVLSRQE